MQRVTLHIDRRSGRVGAWVLVIDGVSAASGARESMVDLLTYSHESYPRDKIVTHVACVHCRQGA